VGFRKRSHAAHRGVLYNEAKENLKTKTVDAMSARAPNVPGRGGEKKCRPRRIVLGKCSSEARKRRKERTVFVKTGRDAPRDGTGVGARRKGGGFHRVWGCWFGKKRAGKSGGS